MRIDLWERLGMSTFFTKIVITAKDSASSAFRVLNRNATAYHRSLYAASSQTRQLTENTRSLRVSLSQLMAAYAALSGGQYIMKTAIAFDSYERSIEAATGSQEKAADAIQFLEGTADRLGLSLKGLMQNYKDLAGSARGSNLEGDETKKIMLAVGTASASMGLSVESTKLMLKAFRDMISKGKISAEELTQQLGDHLPNALGLAADSMDKTKSQLLDMMRKGELMAEDLIPRLTHTVYHYFSAAAERSLNSARANLNRLQNSFDQLVRTFSKSELMTTFIDSLKEVNLQMEFWLFNNVEFIRQDLPGHIQSVYYNVKSFLSFLSRNPAIVEYGLVGYLVGGKKGLAIGAFLSNFLPPDLRKNIADLAKWGLRKTAEGGQWASDKRLEVLRQDLENKRKSLEDVSKILQNPLESWYEVSQTTIQEYRVSIQKELSFAENLLKRLQEHAAKFDVDVSKPRRERLSHDISWYRYVLGLEDEELYPFLTKKGEPTFYKKIFGTSGKQKELFDLTVADTQKGQREFVQRMIFRQQSLIEQIRDIQTDIELFTGEEQYSDNALDVSVNEAWESFLREKKERDDERKALRDKLFNKTLKPFQPSLAEPDKKKKEEKKDKIEKIEKIEKPEQEFVDIEKQFREHALRMENIAYQGYSGIAGAFEDTVYGTITGQLRDIESLGRSVADSLAQSFSRIVGDMFTQSFYSALGLPYPGFGQGMTVPAEPMPIFTPGHPEYVPSNGRPVASLTSSNISFNIVDRVGVRVNQSSPPRISGSGMQMDLVIDSIEESIVENASRGRSPLAQYLDKKYRVGS